MNTVSVWPEGLGPGQRASSDLSRISAQQSNFSRKNVTNFVNLIYTCKNGTNRIMYTCNSCLIRLYTSLVTLQSYPSVRLFKFDIQQFGIFGQFLAIFRHNRGNNFIYRHIFLASKFVFTQHKSNFFII